ncbi:hypothetical protein FSB08_39985 [Paraburkholderia sp. JPY432]|uniref:reverse transcriptase N-terminal domain-containing protein n=1 Tax=Paraburkholderia youngii TaxID=2782701 RepID=UPI0015956FA0|nr:reverse transcriptase N-terminal domain-containing protein [Paraburkholderia youngii]NVH78378.1 hypothetical protein [Paraburkholderia youngii]
MTEPAEPVKGAAGTGAPPADGAWNQINWDNVTAEVTRLQVRIAKATRERRWNKVQALQHLLTHSRNGKLLAVKRVTENAGKRTAGVDGRIWATPMSKLKATQALTHKGYQPLPLRGLGSSKTARQSAKAHVVRYADDFIVTGANQELLEQRVKPAIEAFLSARGLQLAPEKTLVTHIARGFDFLGQNVRKYGDKLLIKPACKSVQALLNRVSEVLGKNKAATQSQVIMKLNPILRGWAMYHRHVVAAATFSRIDHLVWTKLWRWAKRRHPQKNALWIKGRYFERRGLRNWIFACHVAPPERAFRPTLFRLTTVTIKRQTKVRSDANPFDPAWTPYFQRRANGC